MPKAKNKFEYKGKKYTIQELEALPECVVSANSIYWRLMKTDSFTVEQALTTPVNRDKNKTVFYRGVEYSYAELSKHPDCVVNPNILRNRIVSSGWDVDTAVTTPVKGLESKAESDDGQISIQAQKRKERAVERARIKKIMARPINPITDRYTATAKRLMDETNKEIRGN